MTAQDEDFDIEAKYHLVKKKYQELRNLRIDSVAADTEDLRKKADEHRRIHELAVKELRAQNDELKRMIQDAESTRVEMERVKDSNSQLSRQLQMRDPILSAFLKRPGFRLRVLGKQHYEISYGDGKDFVFTLAPSTRESGYVSYESVVYPPQLARQSETMFVSSHITFRTSEMAGFCDTLCRGIKACNL